MSLNINDTIVYGADGVCRVAGKIQKEICGQKKEYYVLKPVRNDSSTIYAPMNNEKIASKIRHILSVAEIYELIQAIPQEKTAWISNDTQRREEYRKILSGGDRLQLLQLIRTLSLLAQEKKSQGRKLHFSDERFLKEAEKILYEEFAYVLNITPEQVLPFILAQIELNEVTSEANEDCLPVLPGDHVICRSGGVWKIAETTEDMIRLAEHGGPKTKTIPAVSNEIVRKIANKDYILEIIDRIGFIRTIQAPNDKVRREFYEEAMSKYDELEWIKVIKTVYLRAEKGQVPPYEELLAAQAKAYFHGEVSVLLDIPLQQVTEYISSAVENDAW